MAEKITPKDIFFFPKYNNINEILAEEADLALSWQSYLRNK